MHGDWFYTTDHAIFGHEVKATEISPPGNLTRWIITQSKGFTKKHKPVCEGIRLFSSYFSDSGKVKHSW